MNDTQSPITPEPYQLIWSDPAKRAQTRAIVVGVTKRSQEKELVGEHLHELKLLADTQGIPVVKEALFTVRNFTAATFLSTGKVEELQGMAATYEATLIIFDDEISPAQQRNLERLLKMPVIDRTEVILGVFAMRAKSREAKLQVELAQTKYLLPRLKRLWTHLSRQTGGGGGAGGGGYLKGEGEKQIEIDRRLLKRRVERLEKEIHEIRDYREVQRQQRVRSSIPVLAIVGYTNAGKSTLMNALTKADVYIENKLFATLDTTTRKYLLPNNQEVLFIDTVGFIRKLPHLLVAAFRSTLEEAIYADIILHVIDAGHPLAQEQAETTLKVLKELDSHDAPIITILNKIDTIPPDQMASFQKLKFANPRSKSISALNKTGLDELEQEIINQLQDRRKKLTLRIPQKDYRVMALAMRDGKILKKEYDENDVLVELEVPAQMAHLFEQFKVVEK
jgi:GTPase